MSDYVNNKNLLSLIKDYKKTNDRKIYNKIGKIFILIAENSLNRTKFINYSQDRKDEMISDATWAMCKYILTYDENISKNAFSYFSQTAYNSFLHYINTTKKLNKRYISLSYIENFEKNSKELY